MSNEQNEYMNLSNSEKFLPQEEVLDIHRNKSTITIGVPSEITYQESRIPLVPQAVGLLVANGHKVLIETEAGKAARFKDDEYAEVGAQIVYNNEEVYQADIIVKVAPPTIHEIELLKSRQTLISSLHLTGQSREYFEKLGSKRMTTLGYCKGAMERVESARSLASIWASISSYATCSP